jgi:hypothetical protein
MHPQRIEPQAGQESVWDYPRPAILEDTTQQFQIQKVANNTDTSN